MSDLAVMMPSLRHLNEQQKMEIKRPMYRSLGTGLAERLEISVSKAVVFTKNRVSRFFGEETLKVTDATPMVNDLFGVLSTDPIETKDKFNYWDEGFQYHGVHLNYVRNEEHKPKTYTWNFDNKKYVAKTKSEQTTPDNIIDAKAKSPNYDKMWEDKKLTGVVLISNNLGEAGPRTSEHYLQYYADKGFEFENPTEIKDTKAWIANQVSSGKTDYVLKEAHAGGNTTSLITITEKNRLMRGTKKLPNGREEEIYVLFPDSEQSDNQRLAFTDMKEWMDKREKDKKGPLVYLNSSCWSMDQATKEVPGVDSKEFVNIASTSTTTTFFNGKNSTKYHIIEGIRKGESYKEMRKGMATTSRHKAGYNQFLFPNDENYKDRLSSWHTDVSITENGKDYHIDENH